ELQPRVRVLGRSRATKDERSVGATGLRDRGQPRCDGADSVLHASQKCNVDQPPSQPTEEPRELDRAGLKQGVSTADVGRRAEIAVTVLRTGLSDEIVTNAGSSVNSALHGVLSDTRQVVATGEVTDYKDVGMPGHRQVGCHGDASGMVGLRIEHLCDMPCEW